MKKLKDWRIVEVRWGEDYHWEIQYRWKFLWLFSIWYYLQERIAQSRCYKRVTYQSLNSAYSRIYDEIKIANKVRSRKIIRL